MNAIIDEVIKLKSEYLIDYYRHELDLIVIVIKMRENVSDIDFSSENRNDSEN